MGRSARRSGLNRTEPSQRPVIIVAGPTASGKSALALDLARALGGWVINADSMQVYRELRILTARPSPEEEALAPHRLYGVLPAAEACSAARWREMALAEIAQAHAAARLPVLCGGTGLYLRALIEGLSPIPDVPAAIRDRTRRRMAEIGSQAFHAELAARDPAMGGRLHPGDTQRLIRAAEVLAATGRSLADWQDEPGQGGAAEGLAFYTIALLPPRAALRERIQTRFAAMLEAGALEEVRALAALGLPRDIPAMKAHGVPELMRHLKGEIPLEEAARRAVLVTGQYAKRQFTWLRHQIAKDYVVEQQYSRSLAPEIVNKIRPFLLTLHE
ncbi:MAG: tRNA delta(2)-isopentenylpyrophosphate transferase [Rhodospirillales bacterium]|nr:tRNA delta(2)-isopentenylpyrophosphate transferase [Rhodospirillales bacterium]